MQKLLKPAALALAIAIGGTALATAASAESQQTTTDTTYQQTLHKPSLTQTWVHRHDPE
jgi:hypothetical protein